MKFFCQFLGLSGAAFTFTLRTGGAAEGAVFIFNKMATENNVLAGLGIFTANPEEKQDNLCETSSGRQLHSSSVHQISSF